METYCTKYKAHNYFRLDAFLEEEAYLLLQKKKNVIRKTTTPQLCIIVPTKDQFQSIVYQLRCCDVTLPNNERQLAQNMKQ